MEHLNVLLFKIFLFFSITSLNSQCDSIVLKNQQDVNQFIINHGKCTVINHLIINDVNANITQLDSLYLIERINGELRLNFRNSNENIKNINGLENLKFAGAVYGNSYKVEGQFINLDSVSELGFNGKLSEFTNEYFSYFPKLKSIEKRLFITNPASEISTPRFNTGSFFELHISSGIDSSTLKLLSNRVKKENLKSLTIFPSDGIDLRHLTILDSVENLHLSYCKNSNFAQITTIKMLKTLILENDLGNNDYGEGLKNIEDLESISIQNNKLKIDYQKILPNLKSVNDRLLVYTHDSLTNLSFLNDVIPPKDSSPYNTILISDNKRLNDCNTSFLCEALARYPESVIIQNNGAKCTKEEILKYCKTVNTHALNKQNLIISPNPTYGYLNFKNIDKPVSVKISDLSGHVVKTINLIEHELYIDDLPQGLYIFEIRNDEISERHKIAKLE
ncbi:MAG: T9SS type A sorting domain-containing protein [Saprospiraceae bacterium]